jgi:hypothetical protein
VIGIVSYVSSVDRPGVTRPAQWVAALGHQDVARSVALRAAVSGARLFAFIVPASLCGLLAGCGGGSAPVSPDAVLPALSQSVSTENIDMHYAPGDVVESEWQEEFHRWATTRLGVVVPGVLQVRERRPDAQPGRARVLFRGAGALRGAHHLFA